MLDNDDLDWPMIYYIIMCGTLTIDVDVTIRYTINIHSTELAKEKQLASNN